MKVNVFVFDNNERILFSTYVDYDIASMCTERILHSLPGNQEMLMLLMGGL